MRHRRSRRRSSLTPDESCSLSRYAAHRLVAGGPGPPPGIAAQPSAARAARRRSSGAGLETVTSIPSPAAAAASHRGPLRISQPDLAGEERVGVDGVAGKPPVGLRVVDHTAVKLEVEPVFRKWPQLLLGPGRTYHDWRPVWWSGALVVCLLNKLTLDLRGVSTVRAGIAVRRPVRPRASNRKIISGTYH